METNESVSANIADAPIHQVQRSWSPYAATSAGTRARLRRIWAGLGFDHDLASKLRYEVDMGLLRLRCALSPAHKRQLRRLAAGRDLLVHLGCGNALLPGWINVDCYPPPPAKDIDILTIDVRHGLPLATASVAALFSEHFLEHLPFGAIRSIILPEIKRVLKPGGKIRIGVPDGEYFIDQYISYRSGKRDELFDRQRNDKTPMTMLNEIAHGFGHYFAYDFETIANLLTDAGFLQIRRCRAFGTSEDEFVAKDRADEWRNAMTLYVEAEAARSSG
jgi:predicted SAM-dependent methyltransferase